MHYKEKGFSLIELLIVVAIILIIAAIAIPNLLRSKMASNEAATVAALRTINTSSVAYSTSYGAYPGALVSLGPIAAGGTPSATVADLIDSVLALGIKSGYNITYTPGAGTPVGSYTIAAAPVTLGVSGQRGFFTDQSGVIRADPAGSATASSTPLS